ncbi:DNA cytosine methyltransferase [Methylorubrum zatmanii]
MPSFVDLFSGAGGLSLGLVRAGWTPLLAVDQWPDAVRTYRYNFPDHPVVEASLEALTAKQLRALVKGTPDWVVGGPPCQGFSTVGKRLREDPRNKLVHEFARIVDTLQPQGFLVENVVGLRDMDFVDAVTALFQGLGYTVTSMVLRAADYGVPQLRSRIFFVGDRTGRSFDRPRPTHSPLNYVSVDDAIGDLPALAPGESARTYLQSPATTYQRKMRRGSMSIQGHTASKHPQHLIEAISHIPDGGNRRSIPAHLQPKSGYHNSYSRLHSGSPAVAVTQNMGKPSATRCIHPTQHRGLTAREGARLQGFPDAFHFSAGSTSQRLQIANAVSPILAEAIGRALSDETQWQGPTLLAAE